MHMVWARWEYSWEGIRERTTTEHSHRRTGNTDEENVNGGLTVLDKTKGRYSASKVCVHGKPCVCVERRGDNHEDRHDAIVTYRKY